MTEVETNLMIFFIENERDNFILRRGKDILDKVPDAIEMLAFYDRQILFWMSESNNVSGDE